MTAKDDIKRASEKRLVPELRFPEFEKDGEWEEKKLGEIANIINEKCKVKDLKIETYISTENILKDYAGVTQIAKLPQTGSFTLFSKGDILVANIRPYLKKIWIADFDGTASNDVIAFRSNENMNNSYVSHLIKNDEFVNYCMAGAKGVKMPRGDKEMMINYSVPKPPSTDEQQKIAECLSSIDEEISALKEKVVQLKAHKKGLMQKLFPDAGKFLPEIRFPEFKNDGGWKDKRLENLCKIGNGKDYKHLNKGHIPVYGSGGYMTSVDDFLYDGDSVCIGRKGTIDRSIFLTGKFWTVDTLFYTHSFCCCLPKFLYCFFQQIDWYRYNEAGGVPSLSKKTIEKIKLPFPSHAEQQEIAECLSSIDELISLYEDKVSLLEQHKKGLMQRLFPKQINS